MSRRISDPSDVLLPHGPKAISLLLLLALEPVVDVRMSCRDRGPPPEGPLAGPNRVCKCRSDKWPPQVIEDWRHGFMDQENLTPADVHELPEWCGAQWAFDVISGWLREAWLPLAPMDVPVPDRRGRLRPQLWTLIEIRLRLRSGHAELATARLAVPSGSRALDASALRATKAVLSDVPVGDLAVDGLTGWLPLSVDLREDRGKMVPGKGGPPMCCGRAFCPVIIDGRWLCEDLVEARRPPPPPAPPPAPPPPMRSPKRVVSEALDVELMVPGAMEVRITRPDAAARSASLCAESPEWIEVGSHGSHLCRLTRERWDAFAHRNGTIGNFGCGPGGAANPEAEGCADTIDGSWQIGLPIDAFVYVIEGSMFEKNDWTREMIDSIRRR